MLGHELQREKAGDEREVVKALERSGIGDAKVDVRRAPLPPMRLKLILDVDANVMNIGPAQVIRIPNGPL